MQNPLEKSHTLQVALALVSGDDGTLELSMCVVELGLVGDDLLVKTSKPHNISFEPPVVHSLDCIKEGSVSRGRPLKGLMDPMG